MTVRSELKAQTHQRIFELRQQGLTHRQIAERLGITASLVQRRLKASVPSSNATISKPRREPLNDAGIVPGDRYAELAEQVAYWKAHALHYKNRCKHLQQLTR